MALSNNARLVESVLFLENEPLSIQRISSITSLDENEIKIVLDEISEEYYKEFHGLSLVENAETWVFVPCADLYDKLRNCYGKKVDRRLTRSAMETLSIIAYQQPITRSEVRDIRGVVSDSVIRLLRERDYIKVVGRKDVPGHPCLYGTTKKFLFTFNLQSISDLPKLSEADKERFEVEKEENNEN